MISFKIITPESLKLTPDDIAVTSDGEFVTFEWRKCHDDYTWGKRTNDQGICVEFDPESAAEFLRSKGYKVKPPAEPAPMPNGCFRIECTGVAKPLFVEGQFEEKSQIVLDFERRGYKIQKIEFAPDQFYFV